MYEKWLYFLALLQYYAMFGDLFVGLWGVGFEERKIYFKNWKKSRFKAIRLWKELWRYMYTMEIGVMFKNIPAMLATGYSVIFKDIWEDLPEELR